jgi:RNA polymerase sigma factor (sigma-70 family)
MSLELVTTTTPHLSTPDTLATDRHPSRSEAHGGLPDDTAELTRRLRNGEEPAFCEFHARYFDRLYHLLLALTRGQETEAREALQETLVRVARYVHRFESEEVFWCWLKRVAWSVAKDIGRKQQRYRQVLERFFLLGPVPQVTPHQEPSDCLPDFLEESLDELELRERQLVEGKYIRGLTVRELAQEFDLTEKAVESQLSRIRRFLRAEVLKKLGTL